MDAFQGDIAAVWKNQVFPLYLKINREIRERLGVELAFPNFDIADRRLDRWGYWDAEKRTLGLSERLFREFAPAAVERVLRHEMAHQLVSEYFRADNARPHGEAFRKACAVLNIPPDVSIEKAALGLSGKDDGAASVSIIEKIRKILAKGECGSVTRDEAEIFLAKARELMVRHNISRQDLTDAERLFLARPVGGLYKKTPTWLFAICRVLENHYFVRYIRRSVELWEGVGPDGPIATKSFNRVELFGELSNLDAAEYIFYALLAQGERLWEVERKRDAKLAKYRQIFVEVEPRQTKTGFLYGLYMGYDAQLERRKEALSPEDRNALNALIKRDDPLLSEMYSRQYPRIRSVAAGRGALSGFENGYRKGLSLRVHPGLAAANRTRQTALLEG